MRSSAERARVELAKRLRGRREEIEAAVLTRVYAISDPAKTADPTYPEGLRSAVAAALDYGLAGVEPGEERPPPAPTPLLAQARLAARNDVSLDTVMRRYFAGYVLLGDFLVEEAQRGEPIRGIELKNLLRVQASRFDRLLTAIGEEHGREADTRGEQTSGERRSRLVERLLAGELLDASELAYELEGFHLGAIVSGSGAEGIARQLAGLLDRRLLLVPHGEEAVWLWLGGRRAFEPEELRRLTCTELPAGASLSLGEPGEGLPGWRLTHRQAKAALPIALRKAGPTRYSDVALLASILNDELLAGSLRQLYLEPLEKERDGGEVMKRTLRAYFAAGRNVSSAGIRLGISRNTVASRLQAIEKAIGCPLVACTGELEVAMQLSDLGDPATASSRANR
jgi:hypothetical protein